ncbi:autotransporter outer membrane beta-barrel domain-containing protein [Bordetella sp. 15P40C-2]|uniref:autotransporter outer membrane beta-barrel domain-containing protein n=1 Tax=Bordetella sp. 15P40C-2 TaxID=2572246 RepID=UPI00132B3299|nr:autotransporter outer membrane beta-barrel domain-containing protein [Bordetella sp. 15P40C-2]MVW71002.1 autotransporter outer membrane beta-barrel domain-containing protein [Bordetella sp. 15P40C-2]
MMTKFIGCAQGDQMATEHMRHRRNPSWVSCVLLASLAVPSVSHALGESQRQPQKPGLNAMSPKSDRSSSPPVPWSPVEELPTAVKTILKPLMPELQDAVGVCDGTVRWLVRQTDEMETAAKAFAQQQTSDIAEVLLATSLVSEVADALKTGVALTALADQSEEEVKAFAGRESEDLIKVIAPVGPELADAVRVAGEAAKLIDRTSVALEDAAKPLAASEASYVVAVISETSLGDEIKDALTTLKTTGQEIVHLTDYAESAARATVEASTEKRTASAPGQHQDSNASPAVSAKQSNGQGEPEEGAEDAEQSSQKEMNPNAKAAPNKETHPLTQEPPVEETPPDNPEEASQESNPESAAESPSAVMPGTETTPVHAPPSIATMPIHSPRAGAFASNLLAANTMFQLSLQERLANYQPGDMSAGNTHGNAWIRYSGSHSRFNDASGQLHHKGDKNAVMLGVDLFNEAGRRGDQIVLGIMGGYGHYHGKTTSNRNKPSSSGTVNGYSFGAYGTYYENGRRQDRGAYIDSWLLWNVFDNRIKTDQLAADKYKAKGLTAGLEVGYDAMLAERGNVKYKLQPHAQLIYQNVRARGFDSGDARRVSVSNSPRLQTVLGVRAAANFAGTSNSTFTPHVELNWLHTNKAYKAHDDGVTTTLSHARDVAQVKLGVEGEIDKNLLLNLALFHNQGRAGYKENGGNLTATFRY